MKRITYFTAVIGAGIFIASGTFGQEFVYVGAQRCKTCHRSEQRGKQYILWENSRHAKSYEVLFTDSAQEQAKKQNLEKHPSESPECLKCHGPLNETAPEIKAEGVTCEVCHGPGSGYKKISIMKNKEEAIKNGLIVYESAEDIKTKCRTCHQSETFDFDSSWEKIKHPIPGKN